MLNPPSSCHVISLRRRWRRGSVLRRLSPLHSTETGVALVEDGVDRLEEDITENVKGHVTTGLDAAVDHPVAGVGEAEIFLLDVEQRVANGEGDGGEVVGGSAGGEDVALLGLIVGRARDGLVDGFNGRVIHECKSCASIGNGGVARSGDGLAVDGSGGRIEHPETLAVVDRRVGDVLPRSGDDVLIDVSEGVEACTLVGVVCITVATEVGSEEFHVLRNVVLRDHVLDRGLDRLGSDGVDGTPSETEKAIGRVLLELGGEVVGKLDGLVFYGNASDVHGVCADCARSGRAVTVGDVPLAATCRLESGGLARVEDGVAFRSLRLDVAWEFGGPELESVSCGDLEHEGQATYPEISGASIKVKVEVRSRRSNGDLTQVLGVILHILCADFSSLAISGLFRDCLVGALPSYGQCQTQDVFAVALSLTGQRVGAGLGRVESILPHEVDVGFGTRGLIRRVGLESDPSEIAGHLDGNVDAAPVVYSS